MITVNKEEGFPRDIFGLTIPEPPLWTSYIPYIGFIVRVIFELFSLHGVVGVAIAILLFSTGNFLVKLSNKEISQII